ncbi:MAG: YbaN family protein [Spirochaetales bacterium]|nr:YbaN family protein [Spirochaetales bacterium]
MFDQPVPAKTRRESFLRRPLPGIGKVILIGLGFVFIGLGVLGIFLPLLPTTPFLLLAATCFARSSQKFYQLLIASPVLGKYIKNYHEGNGIPVRVKIFAISVLWTSILFTTVFLFDSIAVRIILPVIALAVSIHIILIRKQKPKE